MPTCPQQLQGKDGLSPEFERTSSGDFNEDVESQSARAANGRAPKSRRQAPNNHREMDRGGNDRGGENSGRFGGYGSLKAGVDEGEPLLREEVTWTHKITMR